jgi:hypothetical protein
MSRVNLRYTKLAMLRCNVLEISNFIRADLGVNHTSLIKAKSACLSTQIMLLSFIVVFKHYLLQVFGCYMLREVAIFALL